MYVTVEGLSFKYPNESKMTLKDVSLGINKGEIVAILGESGSGKSTLLRLISGLEKPGEGKISIDDHIVFSNHHNVQPEKRKVGMVFQDYALFPHFNVEGNIRYGLKESKKKSLEIVDEMLDLINLEDHRHKYPHELSGGQQQRVALARSIAIKPKLMLLDEPFSNLDSHLRHQLRDDLKKLLRKSDTTTIFVTHDEEDAFAIADRIIRIIDGKFTEVRRDI
jgi:iron(III) transport system ATP-binding protein